MRVLLSLVLVAAAFAAGADACGRRHNRNGNGNNAILITPRNPPIRNPPSPAPTPPPPPPPIPEGWVPAPPRPPAQEMTRTNCKARVEFHILEADGAAQTTNSVDRSLIQEQWVYTCKFQVYIEVHVAETNQPVNCACGMSHARKRPPLDPNYQKAFKTKITYFSMVAFDVVRNVVVGVFPKNTFDNLQKNENTTNELARAAATNSMDYENVVQGFSGKVKALSKADFPEALQEGSKTWTPNVVPAMCFTVEEEYISSYKWPQPPIPLLYTTPNVWVSQCYPHREFEGGSFKRQATNAERQRYWFKDFLLFPVGQGAGVTRSGFQPRSRYITAWYLDSNCTPEKGVVSFDREFDSEITREKTFKIYGAFSWKRTYSQVHVVGGVPIHFSNNMQFWRLGFTKVSWKEVYGREADTRVYRQGVTAHALLGTEASGAMKDMPFIGASAKTKLCDKVPADWLTCPAAGTGCADLRASTYAEDAYAFRVPDAALDGMKSDFNCSLAAPSFCREETTLLSFQNFGSMARDYSKRPDSILLTGPRKQFCQAYPTRPVFDSLYFRPQRGGAVNMVKRGVAQQEADPLKMIDQQTTFTPDGDISGQPNRNVGVQPDKDDVVVQPGTGSADANGRPAGDHPLTLFPETYTVPVTLDPYDTTFDDGRGTLFDGQEAPCLEGSRGCTCRKSETTGRQRPQCDAPLECNEQEFCEPPVCQAGQPGCPCLDGNTCNSAAPFKLVCTTDNVCAYRDACEAGSNGCSCDDATPCADAQSICSADGFCLQAGKDTCVAGEGGCECTAEGACTGAGLECNADNVCARPACNSGERGCTCEAKQCEAAFECSTGNVCKQALCPAGDAGCQCDEGRKCNTKGFACRDFKKDGSDSRCVAEGKNCGDQTDRCIRFCGVGNVVRCPPCSNQQPQCAGAAHVVPSVLVALALAVLAALF